MRVIARLFATLVSLTIGAAGCGTPPSADVDAARASVSRANTEGASQYAAESLKAAQSAQAELDAELKAQESKFVKSYDRARELAVAAKAAGDKAAAEAVAGKERAETEAAAKAAKVKAAAAARAKVKAEAVRVGGTMRPPIKVKDVPPVYPAIAQSARVTGSVVIEATIGADGKVADATVVKSVPLLDQAALDAVRQWEYTPSLLNGKPVPVVMTITVNFTRP